MQKSPKPSQPHKPHSQTPASSGRELIAEMRTLATEESLSSEAATRLLFTAQIEILDQLREVHERIDSLECVIGETNDCTERAIKSHIDPLTESLAKIKEDIDDYPSITKLWSTNPKRVTFYIIMIFLFYTIIFTPLAFEDVRQIMAALIGIPI